MFISIAWMTGLIAAYAQSYRVTDLGTNISPLAINNNGDVVGFVGDTAIGTFSKQRAWFYTNGVATSLSFGPGTTNSGANAINNLGQSVGWFEDNTGVRAFESTDCAMLNDLGVVAAPFPAAAPRSNGGCAINDAGQILGTRDSTISQAYLIDNGQTNYLPTLPGGSATDFTFAGGLSQNGAVVYMARTNGFSYVYHHACLYTNGVQYVLPTPVNMGSYGYAINDSNHVVGILSTTNSPVVQQLFFYDGAAITNIGGPATNFAGPANTYSINNYDQVVGLVYDTNHSPSAFVAGIYDPTNGLRDLNTMLGMGSPWIVGAPAAINDPGQIAGFGTSNGIVHAILLTPVLICDPNSFKYHKGNVMFNISGLNGQTVIIQASCDMISWDPIATNVIMHNKTTFTDNDTSGCASHYYRALVVQ